MKKPNFNKGDVVIYKSGKHGVNFGLDNGMLLTVVGLIEPLKNRKTIWGKWLVSVEETNMSFPAGWFKKKV
jgi:hypothetical protein